jgi:[ribosomal protein S18]-alanine N-acetyltransferase
LEKGLLTIGEYQEGDIQEIVSIERDSYPTPWSENLFRSEITSPISRLFVCRTTGKPKGGVLGYIVYWLVDDEIHLHNIAVRKDMRRKGIASLLLEEAIRCSRLEGAHWITLEVRRSNLPAQRMYEKFGFSVRGIRPGYYTDTKEDALIMWADLQRISLCESPKAGVGEKKDA